MSDPFPKSEQVGRGPKRVRRHRANPIEWALIRTAKFGFCRARKLGGCAGRIELHHIVSRAHGGDDIAPNIAPLCSFHHAHVTSPRVKRALAESLTDAEYAYIVEKFGEGALERLFDVFEEPVIRCVVDESGGMAS